MTYGKQSTTQQKPIPSGVLNEKPSLNKLKQLATLNSEGSLTSTIESTIKFYQLPFELKVLADGSCDIVSTLSQGEGYLAKFITVDAETIEMKADALKMANCKYPVLITGETGTGKELIAKSMIGNREGGIRVANCAGLPHDLIESELFGYLQGSFTGATKSKTGMLIAASKGIMFLDEIGELPLDIQGKLLRALQEKKIRPIGSNDEFEIDCKFVCATNKNLHEMVEKGTFRRDLLARISSLELHINPLRDRVCDLVPISESIEGGKNFIETYGKELIGGFFDLRNNVRSLENLIITYNVLGKVSSIKKV